MKVSEIFQTSEEGLIVRIKSFDWKYEFSEDISRQERGTRALNLLESQVYQFWKTNPERAVEIWNAHSPVGKEGIVPSFILRLKQNEM